MMEAAHCRKESVMSNVPMTLPELVLAEHETICGHESTFVELDDGRILHLAAF